MSSMMRQRSGFHHDGSTHSRTSRSRENSTDDVTTTTTTSTTREGDIAAGSVSSVAAARVSPVPVPTIGSNTSQHSLTPPPQQQGGSPGYNNTSHHRAGAAVGGGILKRTGYNPSTGIYQQGSGREPMIVNEFEDFAGKVCAEIERQQSAGSTSDSGPSRPRYSIPHSLSVTSGGDPELNFSPTRASTASATSNPPNNSNNRLTVLGVDVSHFSKGTQFILCAGGVFGFSLIYGFLQELLSVQILGRQLGLFLALCQFIGYTMWSFIFRTYVEHKHGLSRIGHQPTLMAEGYYNRKGTVTSAITPSSSYQSLTDLADSETSSSSVSDGVGGGTNNNDQERDYLIMPKSHQESNLPRSTSGQTEIPTQMYVGLSILRAIDLGMTNLAMQYVNYPAKTLMKSSRVVFTMMFGLLFLRRTYKPIDYVVVGLMVTGLGTFLHADASSSAVFQPIGILMLATSLMCDGAITNMSEALMQKHSVGQDEFIFRLYSIATISIFVAAGYKGDLKEGFQFMMQPGTYTEQLDGIGVASTYTVWKKFLIMSAFSTTGFLGSSCAAAITKEFGALTMSITSTARKATTLFISFMIFPNECSLEHVVGIFIFISSLMVKSATKGIVNANRRNNLNSARQYHQQQQRSGLLNSPSKRQQHAKLKQRYKSSAPNSVNNHPDSGQFIV